MLIDYPALAPYAERYASLACMPLRVMLRLLPGSRIAGYDPINLDNLLARAAVEEATAGAGLPDEPGAYRLPVPLRCLWQSADGLPLWAATPFRPIGDSAGDVAYWHKRIQPGRFTGTPHGTFAIRSTNGRWMERRVPLPTIVADIWQADGIGNPAEVLRLLSRIAHVGKRRSSGFGEVERWEVAPLAEFRLIDGEGKTTRPLPEGALALLDGRVPEGEAAPVGWTPPEWKPALFRPGWWTGTPCHERVDVAV